jgi:hypothetical protein
MNDSELIDMLTNKVSLDDNEEKYPSEQESKYDSLDDDKPNKIMVRTLRTFKLVDTEKDSLCSEFKNEDLIKKLIKYDFKTNNKYNYDNFLDNKELLEKLTRLDYLNNLTTDYIETLKGCIHRQELLDDTNEELPIMRKELDDYEKYTNKDVNNKYVYITIKYDFELPEFLFKDTLYKYIAEEKEVDLDNIVEHKKLEDYFKEDIIRPMKPITLISFLDEMINSSIQENNYLIDIPISGRLDSDRYLLHPNPPNIYNPNYNKSNPSDKHIKYECMIAIINYVKFISKHNITFKKDFAFQEPNERYNNIYDEYDSDGEEDDARDYVVYNTYYEDEEKKTDSSDTNKIQPKDPKNPCDWKRPIDEYMIDEDAEDLEDDKKEYNFYQMNKGKNVKYDDSKEFCNFDKLRFYIEKTIRPERDYVLELEHYANYLGVETFYQILSLYKYGPHQIYPLEHKNFKTNVSKIVDYVHDSFEHALSFIFKGMAINLFGYQLDKLEEFFTSNVIKFYNDIHMQRQYEEFINRNDRYETHPIFKKTTKQVFHIESNKASRMIRELNDFYKRSIHNIKYNIKTFFNNVGKTATYKWFLINHLIENIPEINEFYHSSINSAILTGKKPKEYFGGMEQLIIKWINLLNDLNNKYRLFESSEFMQTMTNIIIIMHTDIRRIIDNNLTPDMKFEEYYFTNNNINNVINNIFKIDLSILDIYRDNNNPNQINVNNLRDYESENDDDDNENDDDDDDN